MSRQSWRHAWRPIESKRPDGELTDTVIGIQIKQLARPSRRKARRVATAGPISLTVIGFPACTVRAA